MMEDMFKTGWIKYFLRLGVLLIISAPFAVPIILVPYEWELTAEIVVKSVLPFFGLSFCAYAFTGIIF